MTVFEEILVGSLIIVHHIYLIVPRVFMSDKFEEKLNSKGLGTAYNWFWLINEILYGICIKFSSLKLRYIYGSFIIIMLAYFSVLMLLYNMP